MRCSHGWLSIINGRILSLYKRDEGSKAQRRENIALHSANVNEIDITEDTAK
jgi:hypothetical protein